MAGINFHPAPGAPGTKMLPGWLGLRGVGDIVTTDGFAVPNRDMLPMSVDYAATLGDLVLTQGYTVPDRSMNPVADYVSGNVKPLGQSGCGCAGNCAGSGATLNGISGVGDIAADFAAIQTSFTAGDYKSILTAPILGVPYAIPIALAALFILPGMLGGGRRRR